MFPATPSCSSRSCAHTFWWRWCAEVGRTALETDFPWPSCNSVALCRALVWGFTRFELGLPFSWKDPTIGGLSLFLEYVRFFCLLPLREDVIDNMRGGELFAEVSAVLWEYLCRRRVGCSARGSTSVVKHGHSEIPAQRGFVSNGSHHFSSGVACCILAPRLGQPSRLQDFTEVGR